MSRLESIKKRLDTDYERQSSLMIRDIMFLVKVLERETEKAEKYWQAANKAELRVQELEEIIEEHEKGGRW